MIPFCPVQGATNKIAPQDGQKIIGSGGAFFFIGNLKDLGSFSHQKPYSETK